MKNLYIIYCAVALSLLAGCKMASSPSSDGPSSDGPSSEPGANISDDKTWTSIAMSSDGEKLAAVVGDSTGDGRHIYTSSDSGAKWADLSIVPDSAIAGDKYWISIAMSGNGEKLAAVVFSGHIYTSSNSGETWSDRSGTGSAIAGNKIWYSIAMSDDGQKLAAVVNGGHIYTSTDLGANWTDRSTAGSGIAGDKYWQSIAMSDDGKYLAAVVGGSSGDGRHIYTSDNYGVTWTDRSTAGSGIAGDKNWQSIAISDDGQELAAVVGGASGDGRHIYTFSNSEATWTNRSTATGSEIAGNKIWISIAMSGNGEKLAAVVFGGHLYTSSNLGADWTNRSTAADSVSVIGGNRNWRSIAMSDDGQYLAAVVYNGHIYTATNLGADWTDRSE